MFFREPTSNRLDPAHVAEIDDNFFSADPFGYFCARINSLAAADSCNGLATQVGQGLCAVLGRPEEEMPRTSAAAATLQQAVDAIALRQHVAETLVRMWLAALETRQDAPGDNSVWASLTDQPTPMVGVLSKIAAAPGHDEADVVLEMLVPPALRSTVKPGTDLARAIEVLVLWINHAIGLLVRTDIHLSASNNKVKHGLAVRPRDDLRLEVVPAHRVPGDGSEIPLSALDESAPIIDRPSVLYLARPPKGASGAKEALELTCLRLDVPTLLAESLMLATAHAAVFHTAGQRHQEWRNGEIEIATYPRLPTGPTPEQLLGKSVVGLRSPVTFRPDGQPSDRGSGIGFADGTFVPFSTMAPGVSGSIVAG